jgi:hypothetical protein
MKDDLMGFINFDGNLIIPLKYDFDKFTKFSNGLAPVKNNSKYGFINKNGGVEIDFIYDDASFFVDGIAPVCINNKWGFIDVSGKIVYELKFDDTLLPTNNYAIVKIKKDEYILDLKKSKLVATKFKKLGGMFENLTYGKITSFPLYKEKYGYINDQSKIIIKPIYDGCKDFSESKAAVKKGNKYGYININGDLLINYKYDKASNFKEGKAVVYLNEKVFIIDENDNIVIDNNYEEIGDFYSGIAYFLKNGKIGYLDKYGNEFIKNDYFSLITINLMDTSATDIARNFSEGLVLVSTTDNFSNNLNLDLNINWDELMKKIE